MGRKVTINGMTVDLDELAQKQKNKAPEAEISKNYSFNGDVLNIQGVACKEMNIQPHESDNIEVVVSGPQSAVESIEVVRRNGEVYVKGNKSSSVNINGTNISFGNGDGAIGVQVNSGNAVVRNIMANTVIGGNFFGGDSVTVINGDNINIVTDGNDVSLPCLEIKVPVGADIDYDNGSGKINIGDTEGDLYVDVGGSTQFTVGSVKSLNSDLSGAATMNVKRVCGNVKIDVSGKGTVKIQDGEIYDLNVNLSGKGNIKVDCTAQRAKLNVSGKGNIYVQHVIKDPRQHISGRGSINIGKIG